MSVAAYVTKNNEWNWPLLLDKLPNAVLDIMDGYSVLGYGNETDQMVWGLTSSGNFTLKSAYEMLSNEGWNPQSKK